MQGDAARDNTPEIKSSKLACCAGVAPSQMEQQECANRHAEHAEHLRVNAKITPKFRPQREPSNSCRTMRSTLLPACPLKADLSGALGRRRSEDVSSLCHSERDYDLIHCLRIAALQRYCLNPFADSCSSIIRSQALAGSSLTGAKSPGPNPLNLCFDVCDSIHVTWWSVISTHQA